jgi:hypothetical protein
MDRLRAAIQSRMLLLAGGLAVLTVLSGCGSSTSKPDPARVARLVAEANTLCGSLPHQTIIGLTPKVAVVRDRLAAISKSLGQAAAYLPAGRALNEASARRRALTAEMHKPLTGSGGFLSGAPELIERLYRLQVQIHDDEKALGLTSCLSKLPRPPISG